jgi:hypothetical protein
MLIFTGYHGLAEYNFWGDRTDGAECDEAAPAPFYFKI